MPQPPAQDNSTTARQCQMDLATAEDIYTTATDLLHKLTEWQAANPTVSDYRINDAREFAQRTHHRMGLVVDDRDPWGDAARARLREVFPLD